MWQVDIGCSKTEQDGKSDTIVHGLSTEYHSQWKVKTFSATMNLLSDETRKYQCPYCKIEIDIKTTPERYFSVDERKKIEKWQRLEEIGTYYGCLPLGCIPLLSIIFFIFSKKLPKMSFETFLGLVLGSLLLFYLTLRYLKYNIKQFKKRKSLGDEYFKEPTKVELIQTAPRPPYHYFCVSQSSHNRRSLTFQKIPTYRKL